MTTLRPISPNSVQAIGDSRLRKTMQEVALNFAVLQDVMLTTVYDVDEDGLIDLAAGGLELDVSGVLKGSIIVCNANGVFALLQSGTENYVPSIQGDGTVAWGAAVPTLAEVGNVTITSIASGELLKWNGSAWVNQTLAEAGIADTSHAATHERTGADEMDGDHVDIDFTPANYTPDTAPAEAAHVDDLAAHLKGIDTAIGAAGGAHTLDSATHSDVGAITEARGQVLYYGAANWGALNPGTSGKYLKTQGAGADPVWDTVDADTVDGHDSDALAQKVTFSVGGEAGDEIQVTLAIADLDGNGLSEQHVVHCWLSDGNNGGETGTVPDTKVDWSAGEALYTFTANKQWDILTSPTGGATLDIGESGADTWYLLAEIAGRVWASAAITFT